LDDERRLIRRIQRRGDPVAADALVRRYYDEIARFIRRQISDGEVALDLTQEVFISTLRTIGNYHTKQARGSRGASFRTWLYRIATNKLVDWFRSRSARRVELPLDEGAEVASDEDIAQRVEDEDFAQRISAAIVGEAAEAQTIFRLHIFGGYTFAEIAKTLRIPESTAKTKYYRLLNRLRKEFAEYDR
jgi:RNA polymerase sigma-70 factor (ECF subfamily)